MDFGFCLIWVCLCCFVGCCLFICFGDLAWVGCTFGCGWGYRRLMFSDYFVRVLIWLGGVSVLLFGVVCLQVLPWVWILLVGWVWGSGLDEFWCGW